MSQPMPYKNRQPWSCAVFILETSNVTSLIGYLNSCFKTRLSSIIVLFVIVCCQCVGVKRCVGCQDVIFPPLLLLLFPSILTLLCLTLINSLSYDSDTYIHITFMISFFYITFKWHGIVFIARYYCECFIHHTGFRCYLRC